jgi:hypothetical protein
VEVAITAIAEKAEEVMAIAVSSDEEPSQPDQLTDLDEELLFLLDGDDEGASEESRDDQKDGKHNRSILRAKPPISIILANPQQVLRLISARS